jgi:hypothetical protein
MITTQSAKTTIYYTAYSGDQVPIYNGSSWTMTPITGGEISVLTTDTTKNPAAIGASKVNDWFIWNDAGTIRISHGPDWTDDTTRSAGTALVMVNGILLNNASITNGPAASRGTYVGTTRSNASSQLDWIYGTIASGGTAGFFGVWNAYNRRLVESLSGNSADSWVYASITIRSANNSGTTRHSFVSGLAEDMFYAEYGIMAAGAGSELGIGYDVTNAFSSRQGVNYTTDGCTVVGSHSTTALGFHFFQACEAAEVSTTFFGDDALPGRQQSGILFRGWM